MLQPATVYVGPEAVGQLSPTKLRESHFWFSPSEQLKRTPVVTLPASQVASGGEGQVATCGPEPSPGPQLPPGVPKFADLHAVPSARARHRVCRCGIQLNSYNPPLNPVGFYIIPTNPHKHPLIPSDFQHFPQIPTNCQELLGIAGYCWGSDDLI